MGSSKTVSNNTTTTTATPEETALNAENLKMVQFMAPYQQQMYSNLSGNINAILTGQTPMAKGIGGIDETQNQEMVNASIRDITPGFQTSGLMDSGTAIQAATRAAADTRNANAQFNVTAAQNLFNLAVGGQSNLQSQGSQLSSILGNQLAGLRTTSSTGTVKGQNPFINSFETSFGSSLGKTLGSPKFQMGPMSFGG